MKNTHCYACPPPIRYTVSHDIYFQPFGFADLLTSEEMKQAALQVVEYGPLDKHIELDTNWGCSFKAWDLDQVERIIAEIESNMRRMIHQKHA